MGRTMKALSKWYWAALSLSAIIGVFSCRVTSVGESTSTNGKQQTSEQKPPERRPINSEQKQSSEEIVALNIISCNNACLTGMIGYSPVLLKFDNNRSNLDDNRLNNELIEDFLIYTKDVEGADFGRVAIWGFKEEGEVRGLDMERANVAAQALRNRSDRYIDITTVPMGSFCRGMHFVQYGDSLGEYIDNHRFVLLDVLEINEKPNGEGYNGCQEAFDNKTIPEWIVNKIELRKNWKKLKR